MPFRPLPAALRRVLLGGILAMLLPAATGCGRDVEPPEPTGAPISPERYARVLSDLVIASIETAPDTQAYRQRRRALLERHGVTEEELRAFVSAYGRNDEVMSAVYERLSDRVDSLEAARSD